MDVMEEKIGKSSVGLIFPLQQHFHVKEENNVIEHL